jgi:hypothetical protein
MRKIRRNLRQLFTFSRELVSAYGIEVGANLLRAGRRSRPFAPIPSTPQLTAPQAAT